MTKVNLGHNDPGLFITFDKSVKMRETSIIRNNGRKVVVVVMQRK